jgi:CelD/BcsL family acetyltransferase involved in cellulose biosynthesis
MTRSQVRILPGAQRSHQWFPIRGPLLRISMLVCMARLPRRIRRGELFGDASGGFSVRILPGAQAVDGTLEDEWEQLVADDPSATFFQTPAWCVSWYRCYGDRYEPLVLTAWMGERLDALAPLAIERATGRIVFAGESMTDVRDVVARDTAGRTAVLAEVLRHVRSRRSLSPLRIGPVEPDSDTARLVDVLARRHRVRTVTRPDTSPYVALDDPHAVTTALRKQSVRRRLNHYRRIGDVALERISSTEQWNTVRDVFFAHHSERQRQTGRSVVFDDPRRRAFQDELIAADPARAHVTVLRVGDRIVAEHYGYCTSGVLWWGAPAHDIAEEQHSPGQVMLALLIEQAASEGFRRFDLTPGSEEFKDRFASGARPVQTIDVYGRVSRYLVRRTRDAAARATRRLRQRRRAS